MVINSKGVIKMKKSMKLWDIVLMNVTAVIGLRWIPIAAGYGASSIFLWLIAAVCFFIPISLVSCELATTWPDEGGMYVWVKNAYGEKPAFMTSWFYWTTNLFYYPSLLTFIAVVISFMINPALAENKLYVCSVILIVFWSITLVNLKGLKVGKWLSNLSGTLGTLFPGLVIIVLGIISAFIWKRPVPTDYSAANWIPHLGSSSNIAFLSTLMFAMAGIELTPILAGETENPQKTFPKAIVISAFLIAGTYILGTVAMTFIISPDKIGSASGIMDAVKLIADQLSIPAIVTIVALSLTIGNFGGVSVWVVGPIKMLFESTKSGILPNSFTKLNENDMPQNAMIIQACIITAVVLVTSLLPSVNAFYGILVLMTTINYFIPYLILFPAFIKLRKAYPEKNRPFKVPGGNWFAYLITILGLLSVITAIVLPLIPSADLTAVKDIIVYECEIIGGPIVFLLIGMYFFKKYEKKNLAKGRSQSV